MNVYVHVERLVLDGVDVPHSGRPLLRASVEAELARLIAAEGLSPGLIGDRAVARLQGGELQLRGENDPAHLGRQIARAVYGGIGE